ncbi:WAP four-disulfide core domain protein 12 isoform X2 [Peromyscus leucopus]|uniref:WAP four-disulfide core domain protein 12 isoform X2 n=1 Tax=Peromyscus leucopus TaxID=10041 RepID=UPI0018850EC9|nr:WAP four-disulfide core domain protein 12 isoform X2 [Peromyscus leucopus]
MRPDSILVLAALLLSSALVAGDEVNGDKEGVCPMDAGRCIRRHPPQCQRDGHCAGQEKCCYRHCGYKCVQPVEPEEFSPAH